jgi:hypothetical protein
MHECVRLDIRSNITHLCSTMLERKHQRKNDNKNISFKEIKSYNIKFKTITSANETTQQKKQLG